VEATDEDGSQLKIGKIVLYRSFEACRYFDEAKYEEHERGSPKKSEPGPGLPDGLFSNQKSQFG
jgi:hypothetical protein